MPRAGPARAPQRGAAWWQPTGAHSTRGAVHPAPLGLCREHLLEAHDWVAGDVGATDLLPVAVPRVRIAVGVRYPSGWICAECEWRVGDVPDDELDRPRVEVVYYIRWRDQIKIGTSVNPRLRLASIPHDEVLAFERGGRSLEQRGMRSSPITASRAPSGSRCTTRFSSTSPSSPPASTTHGREYHSG